MARSPIPKTKPRAKRSQKPAPPVPRVTSQKAAARALGVHVRSLRDWEKAAWFPSDGRTLAGWDVDRIRKAREAAGIESAGARHSELAEHRANSGAIREARKRLDGIRAKAIGLRNDHATQAVISRADFDLAFSETLGSIRDTAEQLPALIGRHGCGQCRPRVERNLTSILESCQNAAAERLASALQAWDAANVEPDSPQEPIDLPTDSALSAKLEVIMGRCEFEHRRLEERRAALFPAAAVVVVADELLKILGEWFVEVPPMAVVGTWSCCRDGLRGRIAADLESLRESARKQLESFEALKGIVRETRQAAATG